MQAATGAARVVAFDHIVRNAAMAANKGSGIKIPEKRPHNDLHRVVLAAAGARSDGRGSGGGCCRTALRSSICGGQSAGPVLGVASGIVRRAEPRRGKLDRPATSNTPTAPARPIRSPTTRNQRYYYFPKMQADEGRADPMLRLRRSRARTGFSAHTGFPTIRPRRPMRRRAKSLEVAPPSSSSRRGLDRLHRPPISG